MRAVAWSALALASTRLWVWEQAEGAFCCSSHLAILVLLWVEVLEAHDETAGEKEGECLELWWYRSVLHHIRSKVEKARSITIEVLRMLESPSAIVGHVDELSEVKVEECRDLEAEDMAEVDGRRIAVEEDTKVEQMGMEQGRMVVFR